MKIFISFLQSKIQHPISAYGFWEYYIKNGITEAGHDWLEAEDIDWAYGLVPQSEESLDNWKSDAWQKTLHFLKNNPVDLFLSYLYPNQIDEEAIKEIKKMGIPCVNFFCDNVRNFQKIPKIFGVFDKNWVPEYQALAMYKKAGFNHIHLPMPMWIDPKYRKPGNVENGKVSFIGSKDLQRQLFFEQLLVKCPNLLIDIYGANWMVGSEKILDAKTSLTDKALNQIDFIHKFGVKAFVNKLKSRQYIPTNNHKLNGLLKPKPNFEEYIQITRESNITLGINRYPSYQYPMLNPNRYSRLRDIEAPMLGACYLTEWAEGLDELYEIGTEIEVFSNEESLNDKIKALNDDQSLRKKLRINGQKRALQDHCIPNSLNKLMQSL
ncbi:hypothetical protein DHW03_16570 [Pedobacter yonginense]|uniref:Spore protein YkvP/CgeB glycosyl transferase-like domain-containing protein n=1 Tax=Pedobacter yonginense TaxID=651869 RepID=A0A317EIK9_9SPHI|nr:glycosyltransferase [Pedobacter yonginense]PWS26394.1 hypothetical protein DHW03_16570 [Pedobacter yonginense]